jgi:uncharacterized protein (TIGR03118 family)
MTEARSIAGGRRRWAWAIAALAAAAALAAIPLARAGAHGGGDNAYVQTNLVSDVAGAARLTDPNLVNPWGMSSGPTTPVWVSDNGKDVATLYTGGFDHKPVAIVPLVVSIPGGAPTGQVFNSTSDFVVSAGGGSGPARFIFASEAGQITAWSPNLVPSTSAVSEQTVPEAVYKGLALATTSKGSFLYAANFHAGAIDVFDGHFKPVKLSGGFTDPSLPAGFAPFNIQLIGSRLYVTYAQQDAAKHDDVPGAGKGFVDVFSRHGHLLQRLISGGALNAPWGLALAPDNFGAFSRALLVGNFGDGTINAYDPSTGHFLGSLQYTDGSQVAVNGLWALRFGNGVAGSPQTLLFTAGIADENHGLFGTFEAASP